MLSKDVENMTALQVFLYWITERHRVYLVKEHKEPKPWTDDEILQSVYFTNPYRENDKTTAWFREAFRGHDSHTNPELIFGTIAFRWFNSIQTGEMLLSHGLLTKWDTVRAIKMLEAQQGPVFTGAYMIKAGNGPPGCKIRNVCQELGKVNARIGLITKNVAGHDLADAWKEFMKIPHIGPFMSGQLVADLKYTRVLDSAEDYKDWFSLGPGGARGFNRVHGLPVQDRPPKQPQAKMRALRDTVNAHIVPTGMKPMDCQDVQHCLCELDKYLRVLLNDGMKIKRKYNGSSNL